jgi:hypothetical protein
VGERGEREAKNQGQVDPESAGTNTRRSMVPSEGGLEERRVEGGDVGGRWDVVEVLGSDDEEGVGVGRCCDQGVDDEGHRSPGKEEEQVDEIEVIEETDEEDGGGGECRAKDGRRDIGPQMHGAARQASQGVSLQERSSSGVGGTWVIGVLGGEERVQGREVVVGGEDRQASVGDGGRRPSKLRLMRPPSATMNT